MTEAEWLSCADPYVMLDVIDGPQQGPPLSQRQTPARKERLFATACCRRAWHMIPDYHRRTVEAAERFADGLATSAELFDSYQVGEGRPGSFDEGNFDPAAEGQPYDEFIVPWPSNATCAAADSSAGHGAEDASYWCARLIAWGRPEPSFEAERAAQADIFREIFGNPFRPTHVDAALLTWRDGTIRKLAQATYDERELPSGHLDTKRLAILADALEEAGCTNEDVLGHLRGLGPHVRGCWVVDLLLEKS